MAERSHILRSEAITEQMHLRLMNWGRCYRRNVVNLGYPSKVPFGVFPSKGGMVDEMDAAKVETVVSSFATAKPDDFSHLPLLAFILKVEYVEKEKLGDIHDRARDVSKRWGVRCGRTTYRKLLKNARIAVAEFVESI
ncbi:MAG: hypothetical protein KJO69_00170 [Gammaproteobacteria bacterium]|nr:hypothetical protein [Gammaproteobacteria bacterium]